MLSVATVFNSSVMCVMSQKTWGQHRKEAVKTKSQKARAREAVYRTAGRGEPRMTVETLIRLLQKVEDKGTDVFLDNSDAYGNVLTSAVIEHNLIDDYIAVVLKKG